MVNTVKKLIRWCQTAKHQRLGSHSGKISFNNDNIKFDNNAQKPLAKGLDFAHMNIHDLNADLENLAYNPDTISGKINDLYL